MIELSAEIHGVEEVARITNRFARQMTFAATKAINETLEGAQRETIESLQRHFIVRGTWYRPQQKYGIKAKFSRLNDLTASLYTAADWLVEHETGGTRTGKRAKKLAFPAVGPQQPRPQLPEKVVRALKPKRILPPPGYDPKVRRRGRRRARPFAFIVPSKKKSGVSLVLQRTTYDTKQKPLLMYVLETVRKFKQRPTVIEPTVEYFNRHFETIYSKWLDEALRTAR